MDQREFKSLFRDLIAHLYDYTVLETHPLITVVSPPPDFRGSRGEYMRKLILEDIERFKPAGEESLHDVNWRPYHILRKRYVEGAGLPEISQALSLSERQIRRDNSRALQALSGRIWDQLVAGDVLEGGQAFDSEADQQAFDSSLEILDLNGIIMGIEGVLEKRIGMDGYSLRLTLDPNPILVMSDRIVIRQILIGLVGYLMNFPCEGDMHLQTEKMNGKAQVVIRCSLSGPWSQAEESDHAELLESARYWSRQMKGAIQISLPPEGESGKIELVFCLPLADQSIILVVDDQKPTQQMFRRFLSRSLYQVVGITDPGEVLALARQLKPKLITLDVMMPKVDGWEILQALKMDLTTRDIPILVCSAWEEPELAQSLGAAGFLKKPVRQRDLLAELERLNL